MLPSASNRCCQVGIRHGYNVWREFLHKTQDDDPSLRAAALFDRPVWAARVGCADMSLREQGVVGDMGLRLQGVFRRKGKPLHESQCNGSTHLAKGAVCLRGLTRQSYI